MGNGNGTQAGEGLAMKLETIARKLNAAGIAASIRDYIYEDGTTGKVVMAYHDYDGLYPNAETFNTIAAVQRIAKGHKTEPRGHYTATVIF